MIKIFPYPDIQNRLVKFFDMADRHKMVHKFLISKNRSNPNLIPCSIVLLYVYIFFLLLLLLYMLVLVTMSVLSDYLRLLFSCNLDIHEWVEFLINSNCRMYSTFSFVICICERFCEFVCMYVCVYMYVCASMCIFCNWIINH